MNLIMEKKGIEFSNFENNIRQILQKIFLNQTIIVNKIYL
jgi:hypothetical protein